MWCIGRQGVEFKCKTNKRFTSSQQADESSQRTKRILELGGQWTPFILTFLSIVLMFCTCTSQFLTTTLFLAWSHTSMALTLIPTPSDTHALARLNSPLANGLLGGISYQSSGPLLWPYSGLRTEACVQQESLYLVTERMREEVAYQARVSKS